MDFFYKHSPKKLMADYGSPVYIYNEKILREKCRDMINLTNYPNFRVNYAIKANTNKTILQIIREEGLAADVSSPGEAEAVLAAGFTPDKIMFIVNSASPDELKYAIDKGFTISVDSLSQLKTYGEINPGGKISVRLNPGKGGGHHAKVVTGGEKTKFGISEDLIPEIKKIISEYNLQLIGINHHIGSQNDFDFYIDCAKQLLEIAKQFDNLDFIDIGGGFYVNYDRSKPTNNSISNLTAELNKIFHDFKESYGKDVQFIIEPGRYITAECGRLLGTVHSVKQNPGTKYVGCDIGFSVFPRTTLYDAYHEVQLIADEIPTEKEVVTIVGNQCESGDYIAEDRFMTKLSVGDIICVMDAGAYGYTMSSQYNLRLRPAEVLITESGELKLIRRRDTFHDLFRNMD